MDFVNKSVIRIFGFSQENGQENVVLVHSVPLRNAPPPSPPPKQVGPPFDCRGLPPRTRNCGVLIGNSAIVAGSEISWAPLWSEGSALAPHRFGARKGCWCCGIASMMTGNGAFELSVLCGRRDEIGEESCFLVLMTLAQGISIDDRPTPPGFSSDDTEGARQQQRVQPPKIPPYTPAPLPNLHHTTCHRR